MAYTPVPKHPPGPSVGPDRSGGRRRPRQSSRHVRCPASSHKEPARMVRIRMKRLGRRRRPFYRINAIDITTKRDGKVLEQLGWYDPLVKDVSKQIVLNEDRVKHWLQHGAQPSDSLMDLFAKRNLVDADAWKAKRAARVERKLKMAAAKPAAPAGKPKAKPAEGE